MNENLREKLEIDTKLELIKEHKCCAESTLCIETYMYRIEQENQQLKEQLRQKDEVIDELIKSIKEKINKSFNYDYGLDSHNFRDRLFTETIIELEYILEILLKYTGDNNE